MWLGLCVVTHSSGKGAGNIFISKNDGSKLYEYDLIAKEWKKQDRMSLSIREKEIIALSMRGFTMDEIADKMYITPETVKFHRKNIFQKLKVKNISEAISYTINYSIL
jgi:DNA-binding CsgD family transcriptional regulator